jgi:hypothetical protein
MSVEDGADVPLRWKETTEVRVLHVEDDAAFADSSRIS